MQQPDSRRLRGGLSDRVILFLATGFGAGWIPFAPGTWGSLVGLGLAIAGDGILTSPMQKIVASMVLLLVGVPICDRGAKIIAKKDPGEIVWDELAAMPIVFCATPITLLTAIVGWGWFRLFDIWKPWPIRKLQDLPGGVGIMIDDVLAAVAAAACLYGTVHSGLIAYH